ncbi:von Willebrand factor A domain-containing protein 2 [Protopterus annectens]|uniref:von Willebrand factor A domain-containing protein 2 n=1 Tax=Protopterus annectens TaxID=7888 RepID=UPI001CFBD4E9|nr:von Willebrand factor A domain-containing protein 2 [Protopterus annectens]XP_043911870.1 von Willebrand factor A domain-containing protein 2 [Protopterus annectens]
MCHAVSSKISLILLLQVLSSHCLQRLLADQEIIVKISTAGQLMQCSEAIDVLILLDGSYSIGKGSFERSKHFAYTLCDALDVNPGRVRVGVVQYSSTPRMEFSLDSYLTKEEVKQRIKKITFKGGSTQTGLALKYLLQKGFPGGRTSPIPQILIILTDGKSQGDVSVPARQLKESGIKIFAVGVKFPRWEELHTLASEPHEQYVLFAENVNDAVNGLYTTLTSSTVCHAVPSGCRVEAQPCERRTLETVKEFKGNHICWKGSKSYNAPYTSLCPFYSWKRVYKQHLAKCYRTLCPDPCDSRPCQNGGTCIVEELETYHCICPPGFGGDDNCAPNLSLDCSVDVLFLIDSSSRTGLEGFQHFKAFVKRFIQAVLSADSPANVGVAQYNDNVKMEVKIGEYSNVPELLRNIDAMQFEGGGIKTGEALRMVTQYDFKSGDLFADTRDDLPLVVVLLTDSKSDDSVIEPAKYAIDREVFLIAVGAEFLKAELNNITSNPQRTILYSSPQDLLTKMPQLRTKICSIDSQGCVSHALDLVFVLDASKGVSRDNFIKVRDFVKRMSFQFDINRDLTQIAVVTYGGRPQTAFALDTHDSGVLILQGLEAIQHIGGPASTGSALLHVYDDVMTVQRGARPGVNKAVVLVTDGAGVEDASVPAQKIRNNGILLYVIGVGDIQRDALLRIAGSEKYLLHAASYEDLKYSEDFLIQSICDDTKTPVNLCKPNPCMNDGTCILRNGSYRCECKGWEGPHCEIRISRQPPRGDLPRPAGLLTNPRYQKQTSLHLQNKIRTQQRGHMGH